MKKRIIVMITAFTFFSFNVIGVFAEQNNNIENTVETVTIENLTIDNQEYTYKSHEDSNARKIDVFDSNNNKIGTALYEKNTEKLFIDGNEVPINIEVSNEYIENFKSIGEWKQFGEVQNYKYNVAANLSASMAIAGIAALVGGPVGAFMGMYSIWQGSKTNCSVKKRTYIRNYNSKSQLKYEADVYWGRNFEEYFYTANWESSPH